MLLKFFQTKEKEAAAQRQLPFGKVYALMKKFSVVVFVLLWYVRRINQLSFKHVFRPFGRVLKG